MLHVPPRVANDAVGSRPDVVDVEGAAWRAAEAVVVVGGIPVELVAPGLPGVEQAPWGDACGGPDDDVDEPSWPPCDPDMPEPLLPKLTFPHPLDECWL